MSQSTSVLRRNGFTFKQFFVAHDRCAMKVGTDGILLGAWAPVAGVKRCLDIGAGSGLLALMLAQRTSDSVIIDAVELESEAAAQAQENINQSPWAERINVHTADIQQWIYSAAIFLIPICISFDTAEKRRYATYLILNRRFSFEF